MWWLFFLPLFLVADFFSYEKEALKQYESLLKSDLLYQKEQIVLQMLPNAPRSEVGMSDYGSKRLGRFGIEWPLRLPSYAAALEKLAKRRGELLRVQQEIKRRKFIQQLEQLYTDAVFFKESVAIANEEQKVQASIVKILQQKVQAGFAKEIDLLKEEQKLLRMKIELQKLHNAYITSKLRLQRFATLQRWPQIGDFLYSSFQKSEVIDWRTKVLEAQKRVALQEGRSVQNFDAINVVVEYEEEPERFITRAGISFALPLYKKRQKELKRLKAAKISLEIARQKAAFSYALQELQRSIEGLVEILRKQRVLLQKNQALFERYRFGFEKGSITLLELLEAKRMLFLQKRAYIQTKSRLNHQIIRYNALRKE